LNQLTGLNAVTVHPETDVPQGGEIAGGKDAAVLIN
jgi:hypothetical protein